MNSKLKDFLEKWANTVSFNEKRTYKVTDFPLISGEFSILLKMESIAKIENLSKSITAQKRICTFAQSGSYSDINSEGDLNRLKALAEELEKKFNADFNQTVDEMVQEINPDGFF